MIISKIKFKATFPYHFKKPLFPCFWKWYNSIGLVQVVLCSEQYFFVSKGAFPVFTDMEN